MPKRNLKAEFEAATAKNAPWGAEARFLDSIRSLNELAKLKKLGVEEYFGKDLLEYYEENLKKWSNPKLSRRFKERYPMVTERLNTPGKIRIFLRGANFREVDPLTMGSVFEDILRRHHQKGEQRVVYETCRDGSKWCDALRIVYHTQLQAWALTDLLLPGAKSIGISSDKGLSIDWRTREERLAAGEHH